MRYHPSAESSSSGFVPDLIHQYPDFYAARVWNLYHVYRLIIQSILLRVSSFVSLHHTEHEQDYIRIEKINRAIVDDVCASVPFLLGYDLTDLKLHPPFQHLQNENCLWPQSLMKASSSGPAGKFSLIWPLYVACSVPFSPRNATEVDKGAAEVDCWHGGSARSSRYGRREPDSVWGGPRDLDLIVCEAEEFERQRVEGWVQGRPDPPNHKRKSLRWPIRGCAYT